MEAFPEAKVVLSVRNPQTWQQSRRVGETLANFAAKVVMTQAAAKRYWLIENPDASDIFDLPSFTKFWQFCQSQAGGVYAASFPQCALGLEIGGMPVNKMTMLWSNAH